MTECSFVRNPYLSQRLQLKVDLEIILGLVGNIYTTNLKNPQTNGNPEESPVLFFCM